jgi:hypothetical protein
MSAKTPRYANNFAAMSYRGPSAGIWYDCPIGEFNEDPSYGQYFFEDFRMVGNAVMSSAFQGSLGRWSVYGAAGAFVNDQQLDGGVIGFGSDGDNEGLTLSSSAGAVRLVKSVNSTLFCTKKTWFEASVGTSTVAATKRDDFVGLAIPALSSNEPRANYPITTTDDTLDATNGTFIGFHRKGTASPLDWSFCFNLAGGTVNYVTNLTAVMAAAQLQQPATLQFGQYQQAQAAFTPLAANQLVKLGFVFDPNYEVRLIGSKPTARQSSGSGPFTALLRVFVNGIEILATFLTAADVLNATAGQAFPTGFMMPTIATMNQTGTAPGNMLADFIGVAQYADS